MFESITTTGVVGVATDFAGGLSGPLLVVGGIVIAYGVANWIYAKVKQARG